MANEKHNADRRAAGSRDDQALTPTGETGDREGLHPRGRRIGGGRFGLVGVWLIELLIVFVGVYAAFKLHEHQAEREAARHRSQIQAALLREIEQITVRTELAATNLDRLVAACDSLRAVGECPSLVPLEEPVRVRAHMWDAALQSGGLNLLPVHTLYRISEFYNILNAALEQLEQLRHFSEREIIPRLDQDPTLLFCGEETSELRPQFAWYLETQRRMAWLAREVTQLGTRVVAELEADETAPRAARSASAQAN